MATHSLNHSSIIVNQQIDSLEAINDHLAKANALIQVALHDDFLDYPGQIIHDYLLALSDILENACDNSAESLAAFYARHEQVSPISADQSREED